jgi:hypothetical protein
MKYKTASGSNADAVNLKTDTLSKHPDASARRLKRAIARHRQIKEAKPDNHMENLHGPAKSPVHARSHTRETHNRRRAVRLDRGRDQGDGAGRKYAGHS